MVNIHQRRTKNIYRRAQHLSEKKIRTIRSNFDRLVREYVGGDYWTVVQDPSTAKTMARCLNYRGITFTMTYSGCSGNVKVFFASKDAERYLRDNPFYFDPHNRDRKLYSIVACNDPYIRENYLVAVQSGEHQYGIIV